MTTITDDALAGIITKQLPRLLAERPELKSPLYHIFLESFADKGDLGLLQQDLIEFQTETRANFNRLQTALADGFQRLENQLDLLGKRWGIRSEAVFRTTMISLLEESFGAKVERQVIEGDEYDLVITTGGEHILVEIAASVKRNIQERLERKRAIYVAKTGIKPARFILAVASIYSHRAQALREAGFDVIEPGDERELVE